MALWLDTHWINVNLGVRQVDNGSMVGHTLD